MKDLARYKELLEQRLKELSDKVEDIEHELEEPGDDDFEEMAVERAQDEVLEGIGDAANEDIRQIQLALKRITEGTYGECGKCGEKIPEKRLEVLPQASLCVECESLLEQSKR